MAKFDTNTLSLFHTFSKTQVNSDATKPQYSSLGNTVNKSGHTVQTSEVWADSIPFFGLGVPADFTATAKLNDLVKDADGVIWQRNATAAGAGECWDKKTTSITAFTVGADGKYTYTYTDGPLVDGSYLINADGKPVVKYHERKQLTRLVSGNNAFIDSENDASRLKIGDAWVEQFIGVTDAYVNGSASVSYAPVLYATSTATSPLKAGAGEDYLDYCATGIILWDKSEATGNEVINCFEYVGEKLDDTVAKLSAAVFGSGAPSEGEQPASLQQQVAQNTAAINTLNTVTIPAIQQSVTDAVTTANGYTDDKIAEELEAGGSIAEAIATAKQGAIDSAKVTLTAGTGITIPNSGTAQTSFTVSVNEAVVATRTYAEGQATEKANAALGEAKTYAEGQASTAKSEAISSANDYTDDEIAKAKTYAEEKAGAVSDALNTAKGELTTAIGTAKTEAIAAAKTETESQVGAAKTELTTAIGTAKTEAITAAKTETETQVAALKTELTTGDDSLGGKITALEGEVSTIKETTIPAAQAAAEKVATDGIAALKTELTTGVIATAQAAADAAQKDATQALADAATAQGTADTALANAATADGKAVAAQKAADDAQADATQALTDAATAQAAADAAQADADALETRMSTAESAITTNTTIITDLKKVSLAKESADGLVKVSTTGTIGTGLESISVTVSDTIVETTDTFNVTSTGSSNVEVKLTGTVANPSIEVKGTDIASAADLTALTTKVDTHIASAAKLSIVVVDGLTDAGVPNVAEPETNKLYLVATGAESGTYAEWIYLGDGTWERIGTTATDLSEYAKTEVITPLITAAQTQADKGVADAATAKAAADAAQKAADDAQADVDALEKLVGTTTVGSQITSAINALGTGATQGGAGVTLTQTNGVVALTVTSGEVAASGDASKKFVKGETVHTAITTAEAAAKKHADDAIAALDATKESAGVKVVQTDGAITEVTVTPGSVAANDASVVTGGAVYTAIKAVSDLVGTTAVATQISDAIAAQVVLDKAAYAVKGTEKVAEDAASAAATAQETADAKIAAVDAKTETYYGAPLVSATTDASKNVTITAAANKEWSVSDVTLTGDTIVEVINGKMMGTGPTIIIDDANLVNGESMFVGQTLMGTFVGNLGKLTNGKSMFSGCTSLVDFCADLGSLTDGTDMFKGCTLSEDSIIYIVDSLPKVTSGTICLGTAVSDILKTEAVNKGWTVVVA